MAAQPLLRFGSRGPAVSDLQSRLNAFPSALPPLTVDGIFGPKTLARVKEFQLQGIPRLVADGIVGPLTWAKLAAPPPPQPPGVLEEGPPPIVISQLTERGSNLVALPAVGHLAAGAAKPAKQPRMVVVTEQNAPWRAWAKQFQVWPFAGIVEIPNGTSLDAAATKIEQAAALAGPGGAILLSVGHGGSASTGFGATDEGFFDLAPSGFRVAGANATLTGGTVAPGETINQVSVFYDRVPVFSAGIKGKSRKQEDEARPASDTNARTRLAHFNRYIKMGQNIRANGVGCIVLLTCKVGSATEFLKRARTQLGAPIAAYKRKVAGQQVASGRSRMFLEGDAPGSGTNIEMGEFWIPMPSLSEWSFIL